MIKMCREKVYTSKVLGTLASLYVELADAVFSKFMELVQLAFNGFSFCSAILTNERRQTIAFGEWEQQKPTKVSRKDSLQPLWAGHGS